MTAMELSKRVGCNINYVRSIERGLRYPEPDAVQTLTKALDLSEGERVEFLTLYDAGRTPPALREAVAALPIPGMILWRRLPHLLAAIPHPKVPLNHTDPDEMMAYVVLASASLLSWVALAQTDIGDRKADELRHRWEQAREQCLQDGSHGRLSRRGMEDVDISHYASLVLPTGWRHILFQSDRTAKRLVSLISEWDYAPFGYGEGMGYFTATFADSLLEERFGVSRVPSIGVISLHDTLVAIELTSRLSLPVPIGRKGVIGRLWPEATSHLKASLERITKANLAHVEKNLTRAGEGAIEDPFAKDGVASWRLRLDDARFASRVLDSAVASHLILGPGFRYSREDLCFQIEAIENIISDFATKANSSVSTHSEASDPADQST